MSKNVVISKINTVFEAESQENVNTIMKQIEISVNEVKNLNINTTIYIYSK